MAGIALLDVNVRSLVTSVMFVIFWSNSNDDYVSTCSRQPCGARHASMGSPDMHKDSHLTDNIDSHADSAAVTATSASIGPCSDKDLTCLSRVDMTERCDSSQTASPRLHSAASNSLQSVTGFAWLLEVLLVEWIASIRSLARMRVSRRKPGKSLALLRSTGDWAGCCKDAPGGSTLQEGDDPRIFTRACCFPSSATADQMGIEQLSKTHHLYIISWFVRLPVAPPLAGPFVASVSVADVAFLLAPSKIFLLRQFQTQPEEQRPLN